MSAADITLLCLAAFAAGGLDAIVGGGGLLQLPALLILLAAPAIVERIGRIESEAQLHADVRAAWHRGGPLARHTVSVGAHQDRYSLINPTYDTPDWRTGDTYSQVATEGDGRTSTRALWAQDAWWITGALRLTVCVAGMLLGSETQRVLTHCKVPVLVYR